MEKKSKIDPIGDVVPRDGLARGVSGLALPGFGRPAVASVTYDFLITSSGELHFRASRAAASMRSVTRLPYAKLFPGAP